MVIRGAFLGLLEKRPLNKITVKEICGLADVNRTTFYSNFYDIYDLHEQIQDELYKKIEVSLKKPKAGKEILIEVFETVKENIDICKILFAGNSDLDFIRKVMLIPYAQLLKEWSAKSDAPAATHSYIFEFVANGSAGFLNKWIRDGMKIPSPEAASLLEKFTSGVISQHLA
ncbi:MAG: TetR family transcriptional regulator C-terminal domain-containing protein [Clostridiales bacterium]|nr:TetR family transcriptional regulator C-terminal domain-containing protein [Clostridiales bacterium]